MKQVPVRRRRISHCRMLIGTYLDGVRPDVGRASANWCREALGQVFVRIVVVAVSCLGLPMVTPTAFADDATQVVVSFQEQVAPLLATRCLGCHSEGDRKGGLSLLRRADAVSGGDSGPAINEAVPLDSLLWERIEADEMPPKSPLSQSEKEILRRWLIGGAKWSVDPLDPVAYSSDLRAGYDWWSLRPLTAPHFPVVQQSSWIRNSIDHFVLAKLEGEGLSPAPEADRRTIIRRLSFDLLGLPPTYLDVVRFEEDSSPRAYENLVDRLLDSPAYGERWARHWLDVVRFGESQGFERDRLRGQAWRYRDWVIQAFNDDLSYWDFVSQQIAGDCLAPDDPLSVIATGFLVAAPWDEVGQSQQSAAMRAVVRQDELEDIVGTTAQTFLGLTANCARCHDHKFDPIAQTEYFQLVASLAGVRHGERESLTNAGRMAAEERVHDLEGQKLHLSMQLAEIEHPIRDRLRRAQVDQSPLPVQVPLPLAAWNFDGDLRDRIGQWHGTAHGGARVEDGRLILDGSGFVETSPLDRSITEKTLEVSVRLGDLKQQGGGVISLQSMRNGQFDSLVFGEREAGIWFAGSEGFARSDRFAGAPAEDITEQFIQLALVYQADGTVTLYRNGIRYGEPFRASAIVPFESGDTRVLLGLRHLPAGGNRHLSAEVDWARLYDRALSPQEVAVSAGVMPPAQTGITGDAIAQQLTAEHRAIREDLIRRISGLESRQRLLRGGPTYAVVPREPEVTRVLLRGNPGTPAGEVAPGGLRALGDFYAEFHVGPNAAEGDRRIQLAKWITDPRNPLAARVIVNRVWHYHFGTGLVDTPNDFGFNGARPSHPELLDWLAVEFWRQGGSLKALHRLIVMSATYRQSGQDNPAARNKDAENRWLWRRTPMRLEAEAVRDAILAVCGELNPQMGGPGFRDFTTFTSNSQFYSQIDPAGAEFQRRSIYRTWVRSSRNPLLDVLDCPDPSTTAPRRAVTTTPLQALALLNNSFVLRMCDRLAARVEQSAAGKVSEPGNRERQIDELCHRILQRSPTPTERSTLVPFVAEHGTSALIRVLLNSNEFLYID